MHQLIDKKNKIILYLMFLLIFSTTSNKIINNEKNHFTKINKIEITGLSPIDNLKLVKKLESFYYKNIFIINKKKINRIVSEYNIIEEYKIKKIYPSKLNIEVKSTKFIAKISGNNQLLVGSNGKLIKTKVINEKLPYIFGEFNSKKFLELKNNIDRSKFDFTNFKSIFFFPSNRWDILTNNDVLIKLPEGNFFKALELAHMIVKNNEFKGRKIIDLRISNQLIVQ